MTLPLLISPPTDFLTIFTCSIVLLGAYIVAQVDRSRIRRSRLAPGPPRLPFAGNILQVPTKLSFIKFTEWSEKYGPIYSLSMLGQEIVVLNNHKTAADLLDRRSKIYSDRPRLILASEILGGGIWMGFTRYGDIWRRLRRAARESFNPKKISKYQEIQTQTTTRAIVRFLKDPLHWETHIHTSTLSVILSSVYGCSPDECEEPALVQRLHKHAEIITGAAMPGGSLVDLLPVLNCLPSWSMKWKRQALKWHKSETEFLEGLLDEVSTRINNGSHRPCFVADILEKDDRFGLSRKEIAWLAGIMFVGGAESTATAIINFIMAMTLYPHVMRKAQAELDAIVGRERAPTLDDKKNLPYIRAIIREVLRWRPIAPLGAPHMTTEDDIYEGHVIPKGTIIFANIWAMSKDPAVYSNFDQFVPERFLDETGTVDVVPPDTHEMGHTDFGYGRRICVGMDFANQGLFIAISTILWAIVVEAPRDANGNVLEPSSSDWIECGAELCPAPFPCVFALRFQEARTILEASSRCV